MGGLVDIAAGYWFLAASSATTKITPNTELYACMNDECCAAYDGIRVRCNVEKGYYGPICGGCDRDNEQGAGFFTRSGSGCAQCWSPELSWLAFLAIGFGLVLAMVFLVAQHNFAAPKGEYGATIQKIAFSHLQMLGVLGIFKAKGTKVFNEVASRPAEVVGGSITSMLPIKCALQSQIYGPFLLTMSLPFLLIGAAALLLIPKIIGERLIRKCREGKVAPTFKGKFKLPRALAVCAILRLPMSAADEAEWHDSFHPTQRFAGVVVFILFTLYPSLVASIATLFNCTALIEGASYLVADMTVECYTGWHIGFIIFGCIGGAVYAIGIPIAVAYATAMKSPLVRDTENNNRKLKCVCQRRSHEKYSAMDVRARFGFLFNGYATDRSGYVVAWESLVMLRKLAVTAAGSMIKDPYLQILSALLILVVSCVATAFVQPYETLWLNVLDTLGLFALILTQIFSILYFYVATAEATFADPVTIEISVTFLLFLINAASLLVFGGFFASELGGLRETCYAKRHEIFIVASAAAARAVLADPTGAAAVDGQLWCHPSNKAVSTPPTFGRGLAGAAGVWVWSDENGAVAVSTTDPELLVPNTKGLNDLEPGIVFRWVEKKTHAVSAPQTTPRNLGGCGSDGKGADAEGGEDGEDDDAAAGGGDEDGGAALRDQVNPLPRAGHRAAAADAPHVAPGFVAAPPGDAVVEDDDEPPLEMMREKIARLEAELEEVKQRLALAQPGAVIEITASGGGAEEEHPRGWSKHHSREHDRTYFVNDHTGAASWSQPTHPAPPEGWEVHPHEGVEKHGHTCFYQHAASGERQWHHPHDDTEARREEAAAENVVKIREAPAASKHPRGWSARTDPATGKSYFHNEHTNSVTWEKPTLPAPPAGWKVRPHAEQGQYYIHIASSKTQFQHPHDDPDASAHV